MSKSESINWIFGALAAASLFYIGILVLLLSMQRIGCCPLVLNY